MVLGVPRPLYSAQCHICLLHFTSQVPLTHPIPVPPSHKSLSKPAVVPGSLSVHLFTLSSESDTCGCVSNLFSLPDYPPACLWACLSSIISISTDSTCFCLPPSLPSYLGCFISKPWQNIKGTKSYTKISGDYTAWLSIKKQAALKSAFRSI